MTVKEILLETARKIGKYQEVSNYLNGEDTVGEALTNELLECFHTIENELALDYLPLYAEEELVSKTGAVYFSELDHAAVRIVEVLDGYGNVLKFQLFPQYLKTQPGKLKIRYSYTPERKTVDGESDFNLHASARLFAYGMAAEYAIQNGLFEEAGIWDRKYKEAISAAYKATPNKKIASRRWV